MIRPRTEISGSPFLPMLRRQAAVFTWIWAFILPIEVVVGVPSAAIDAIRWAGFAVVVLAYLPDPSSPLRDLVRRWGLLLGALAVLQLVAAVLHGDGLRPGVLMVASVVAAGLLALRTGAHRPILYGYLAGCTLSSLVTVMQAMEVPTLAAGRSDANRFPGLATTTVIFTWQVAFAIIIAVWVVATTRPGSLMRWAGLASLVVLSAALLMCGTQGGLLALLVAGGCFAVRAWRRGSLAGSVRVGMVALVAVVVFVVAAGQLGLSANTIEEFLPGSGYENERARLDLARAGLGSIRDHPLGGSGFQAFKEANVLVPHTLPVYMGVAAGLVGLALGTWVLVQLFVVVVRGPRSDRASAVFGWTLTAAMFANTLTEPEGPFTGLSRLPIFAIGLVACRAVGTRDLSGRASTPGELVIDDLPPRDPMRTDLASAGATELSEEDS